MRHTSRSIVIMTLNKFSSPVILNQGPRGSVPLWRCCSSPPVHILLYNIRSCFNRVSSCWEKFTRQVPLNQWRENNNNILKEHPSDLVACINLRNAAVSSRHRSDGFISTQALHMRHNMLGFITHCSYFSQAQSCLCWKYRQTCVDRNALTRWRTSENVQ